MTPRVTLPGANRDNGDTDKGSPIWFHFRRLLGPRCCSVIGASVPPVNRRMSSRQMEANWYRGCEKSRSGAWPSDSLEGRE